jgi:hypothetical protein
MSQSPGPTSYDQPSHQEGTDSSHSMAFHSNRLHRELYLPKFYVNKFDGFNPTGWVTQMEHYLSLHGIADDLIFFLSTSFIWILNVGNGVKIHIAGILLGPNLLQAFINTLTSTHIIWVI